MIPGDRLPAHEPTSAVMERLRREAPPEGVTLAWVLAHLRERSFGILLLLFGTAGLLPGISVVAGLLVAVPAFQMMLGRAAPVFPQRIAARPIRAERFAALLARAVPALRFIERFSRPRWPTPFQATKRVVGAAILLLGACLLVPLPLSNIPPGLIIVLMAIAYLEEDGLLLTLAIALAAGLVIAAAMVVWGMVETTLWLSG
ncbi:exopolysaccharide biosynthesis protein [Pararoseomonas sp. SCSIO 73927]|uniref:exopolysaccharide biosynthesis protein n=1 Tax=Pararoseomonas sp. SCSIO 73927 TaxID=3114537 RepID=UPI0030D4A338